MWFSKQPGHAGQWSVVIDSYYVPRAARAWPWSAIIIVCFKYLSLQLSRPYNKIQYLNFIVIGSKFCAHFS